MTNKTIEQKLLDEGYERKLENLDYCSLHRVTETVEEIYGREKIISIAILPIRIALNNNSLAPNLHNVYILYK